MENSKNLNKKFRKPKPTKAELVQHFKGAKLIKDHTGFKIKNIISSEDCFLDGGDRYFARVPFTDYSFDFWNSNHGYAEIIERKKPESPKRVNLKDTGDFSNWFEEAGYAPDNLFTKVSSRKLQNKQFDKNIEDTLSHLRELLTVKGKEYRRNNNPFHNFDEGARAEGISREKVLHGFRLKHTISVRDMRNDLDVGNLPTREKVEEKYNDILVYYLIEKASMLDRIDNQKEE